jgi:AcrR family transcriptional regulator
MVRPATPTRPAAPSADATPGEPAEVAAEGRRARRRRELHDRIFATARSLFLEQGFAATTVEQIAAAADIAPATFFNHFPSKDHVLRAMAGEVFERFRKLVDEQSARDVSTQERLVGFAERGARLVKRAPELTQRVLLEVLHTASPSESRRELVGIQAYVADLIEEGQRRGDVRTDEDAEFLAELVVSAVVGAMTQWIHDQSYPLDERMRRSAEFLGAALRPDGTRDSEVPAR